MKGVNLNRRLALESPQTLPDGAGGFNSTWVELGVLWAALKAGTGRERAVEAMTASTLPWRITVRAAPENNSMRPRPEQRFRMGNRLFRILAVAEAPEGPSYLTCFAQEETSA